MGCYENKRNSCLKSTLNPMHVLSISCSLKNKDFRVCPGPPPHSFLQQSLQSELPGFGKGDRLAKVRQTSPFPYLQFLHFSHSSCPISRGPQPVPLFGPPGLSPGKSSSPEATTVRWPQSDLGRERPLCPRAGSGCPQHPTAHGPDSLSQDPAPYYLTAEGVSTLGTQVD